MSAADVVPRPVRMRTGEANAVFAGYEIWQLPPLSRSQARARPSPLARRAPPELARDLSSVTVGSPSTPLSAGRLRMHPAF